MDFIDLSCFSENQYLLLKSNSSKNTVDICPGVPFGTDRDKNTGYTEETQHRRVEIYDNRLIQLYLLYT